MSDRRLHEAYALHQQGRLTEAAIAYREILADEPRHFGALLYYGLLHLQGGYAQQAEKILDQALALDPGSFDALSMRAGALQNLARFDEAIALLERALALRPDHAVTWNNRGNLLLERGRIGEAAKCYERALALNPDYAEAWHNRAIARMRASDDEGAVADLQRALTLKPDYADAMEHLGIALAQSGRHEDALLHFDDASKQRPTDTGLLLRGAEAMLHIGRLQEALLRYDAALAREPGNIDALKSRGALLNRLQRYADAAGDFDHVLSLRTDDADAWLGRGVALACLNHDEEAVESFTQALTLRPEDPVALYNRASRYSRLARYGDAARDTEALLAIDPHYPFARGLLMHSRLHICNWRDLAETRRVIASDLEAGRPAVHPFIHLAFSESPSEQLQCARLFAAKTYPAAPKPMSLGARYRHQKIRIAYLSGDYYNHAVAFLAAGVFEHHDSDRFETFGISFSPDDGSEMRARLEKGFTRFIDVRDIGDEAVAAMLRELEIDIAVDLKGYTGGCRPGILSYRPAPVQAQYLGYPGTMGADYIDYLIADRVVIPEDHRAFYAEKIVYLPDMYQCNDSRRRIADRAFSRAEVGLPDKGFVFCCFNGSQKIMPEIFGLWMDLLAKAEDSVLWLLEEHPEIGRAHV